jgi:hypothetical protein
MEIHVPHPHEPAHSFRDFVIQLATITVGILIALSIDGILESNRERALVREAHDAIAVEIADNLRDLEETLPTLDEYTRNLVQALRYADDLLKAGTTDLAELRFQLRLPSLNRASWETAERTGAVGYMEYAQVKEYAELYGLQDLVRESQQQIADRLTGVLIVGEGKPDPSRLRPQDVEPYRMRVLESQAALEIHKSLVRQLADAYKKAPMH